MWNDFIQGNALEDPQKMNRFYLLIFADLKKYIYHYWFAFPTFLIPTSFNLLNPIQSISERFSTNEVKKFPLPKSSFFLYKIILIRLPRLRRH